MSQSVGTTSMAGQVKQQRVGYRPPSVPRGALAGTLMLLLPSLAMAQPLKTVFAFDAAQMEAPESMAIGWDGSVYASLAITGEIAKIDRAGNRTTLAFIPLGDFPAQECAPDDIAMLHGIAVDIFGYVYAGAAACDPANRGIWRVSPDGNAEVIATLPADAHPNGLAVRGLHVYVTDHQGGRIYRAPRNGNGGPAELWVQSPLLDWVPNPYMAPGANGIQFFHNHAYVANSAQQTILRIDIKPGLAGRAGEVKVAHNFSPGCDDFAIDIAGRIFCTTNPFQTVVRIDPDGTQEVLFTAADGLDGPTTAAFGRLLDMNTLYISNAAFPFFPGTGNGPSIQKVRMDLPGYPLR